MAGLPKRFVRSLTYFLGVLGLVCTLLILANKNNVLVLDKYLPKTLLPYFQPASDSFFIDIHFGTCYKIKGDDSNCGLPKPSAGKLGDLYQNGGWTRLDKDLALGSSWTKKQYFSYKTVNVDVLNGRIVPQDGEKETRDDDKSKPEYPDEVIVDIAIFNPAIDSKFKNNHQKLPQHVLDEFHKSRPFTQEDHDRLIAESKAKSGNKKTDALTIDKDKAASKKIGELNKQMEKEKEKEKKEKRITHAEDRYELERNLYIPTEQEVKEHGWVAKSHGIWVKYGKSSDKRAITGIDILFGEDAVDPRPNWNIIKQGPLLNTLAPKGKTPYLSIRRGPKVDYKKAYPSSLKLKNGKFKILQVADLHFSTGYGTCRDPVTADPKNCRADPKTLKFIEKVLDIEKPDLVVLTGDQVFGSEAPDAETALFKALNPYIQRKIPFAVTLGNHDDEGSLSRAESMMISSYLPYSYAAMGPEDVDGYGNYAISVEDPDQSKASAISLYFLDTHSYSQNPKVTPGYDWIKENQMKWLELEAASLEKAKNAYTKNHLSMAFFHIPLPEYRNFDRPFVGQNPEGVTAPRYNTGARSILGSLGVSVVSVGHDHCNDYCLNDLVNEDTSQENKMWLCYGGGVGEGGYGGYGGFIRRLRTFEVNPTTGEILSWKRLENDPENKFDFQKLVEGGKVKDKE